MAPQSSPVSRSVRPRLRMLPAAEPATSTSGAAFCFAAARPAADAGREPPARGIPVVRPAPPAAAGAGGGAAGA